MYEVSGICFATDGKSVQQVSMQLYTTGGRSDENNVLSIAESGVPKENTDATELANQKMSALLKACDEEAAKIYQPNQATVLKQFQTQAQLQFMDLNKELTL